MNGYTTLHRNHLHSSNEEHSQNKRPDLDGNSIESALNVKSLYKLSLNKIPLGGAFMRANISKLYLHYAGNSLINYK